MRNPVSPLPAKILGACLVFLLLLRAPLFGGNESPHRLYFLPLVEVEKVLSRWLIDSGFAIFRTSGDSNQVQLRATKGNESWHLRLKPHSPLACSVQAQYTRQDQPDPPKIEKLWAYLTDYSQGLSSAHESLYGNEQALFLSRSESIVCMQANGRNGLIQFSGFIIDPSGFILSTAHDLKGLQEITVILHNGLELKGRLVKMDPSRDLSLIEVRMEFNSSIALARRLRLLANGEKVYAIGCPRQLSRKIRPGIIEGPLKQFNNVPLWQVSMETLPGSSGSPVFDSGGNLVGVVKGRYRGTDSIGFLIPLETVIEFLKE